VAAVGVVVLGAGAAAAAESGTLTAGDSGLEVLAKPHSSTVIVVDSVDADCAPGATTEREATVVSFAADPDAPTAGARLNQVVWDLGSVSAAKAFFALQRAYEQERVDCGTTAKASGLKLAKGPGGVGDARFTITSKEKIGGKTSKVVNVTVRSGGVVTALIFIDWEPGLPGTTAVAKKAAARLS
jgi:hypothetical protein